MGAASVDDGYPATGKLDKYQKSTKELMENMKDDPQKRLDTLNKLLGLPTGTDEATTDRVLDEIVAKRHKDSNGEVWPFLKRFTNGQEMQQTIEAHMDNSPGKFTRIQNFIEAEADYTMVSE